MKYEQIDHINLRLCLAYFDRYRQVKIFQLQAADDQFFLPDSEVKLVLEITVLAIFLFLGPFLE